jgi:hypothetical protein
VQSYRCCKQLSTEFFGRACYLKPCKLQVVQKVTAHNKQLRLQFVAHVYPQSDNFLNHIIFTDEVKFHISGCVSWHNCVIWGSEPSREHLNLNTVVLKWASRVQWHMKESLPIFLWWGHHYKKFFRRHVSKICSFIAQQQQQSYSSTGWFTSLFCSHCLWLNMNFPGQWIGRVGPVLWSPHSSSLMYLNFFFGAMWTDRYTSKEGIHWMSPKHNCLTVWHYCGV